MVLLQTARTYAVTSRNNRIPVRVLFDNGGQRLYITQQLKTRLDLVPLRRETVNLNVFGSESYSKRQCEVVRVKLQSQFGEFIEVVALTFPSICSPLPKAIKLNQYPYLQELELADSIHTDELKDSDSNVIDLLIGSDYYWDIVEGEVTRGSGGLVAVSSKFGWLVSGPISCDHNDVITHTKLAFVSTNDISIESDEDKQL